jgi:hypothetical protein
MYILVEKNHIVSEVFFDKKLGKQKPKYRYIIVRQLLSKALETTIIFLNSKIYGDYNRRNNVFLI